MERLNRILAGFGLATLLVAPGCKTPRPEVPPGHRYSNDGRQMPSTLFSSDPHPASGAATSVTPGTQALPGLPGMPSPPAGGGLPGTTGQYGTPGPGANINLGAPTNNKYGPPGTSELGSPTGLTPTTIRSYGDPSTNPPTTNPGGTTLPPVGMMGQPGAPAGSNGSP